MIHHSPEIKIVPDLSCLDLCPQKVYESLSQETLLLFSPLSLYISFQYHIRHKNGLPLKQQRRLNHFQQMDRVSPHLGTCKVVSICAEVLPEMVPDDLP